MILFFFFFLLFTSYILCRSQMIIISETEGYWCHTLENNITSNLRFKQSYLSKVKNY